MYLRQFQIEGLGHLSTLIADEEPGLAAVVDPRRDVDVYLEAARARDLRIAYVVETHLHNDYVSGARDLAALTGATHVIGAGAELAYESRGLRDGESFSFGALRFGALDTPGHTPEHVAYAVADTSRAEEPLLLFTGGSLLVGAVGRTDLLGEEHAIPYARAMFHSLHDVILPHEDFVGVFPTHGAGSLCSTGIASTMSSTIGFERRFNPMVQPAEFEEFARVLLGSQPAFPRYFARMRPTNQGGPRLLGGIVPGPRAMSVEEVRSTLEVGGVLIDARDPSAHALEHIPGSLSIPAGSSFGTWLGWVVEPDRPLVLVLDDPADWDDLIRQALRVGYEQVVGHLHGGVRAWAEAGGSVASGGRLTVGELRERLDRGGPDAPLVLDVRQLTEFAAGHVPGAVHLNAGSLPDRLDTLPRDRPIAAICASGYRSSVAASLLRQAGFTDVSWVPDGVSAWESAGLPVNTGLEGDVLPRFEGSASGTGRRPRALVVYAADDWPLRTAIADHLFAWQRHGNIDAVLFNVRRRAMPSWLLDSGFDLIVFHTIFLAQRWQPDVFATLRGRLAPLKRLTVPRLAIPQDEFLHTDILCDFLAEFGVGYVLSCADRAEWPKIYGSLDPMPQIATVLTGYLEPATLKRIQILRRTTPVVRPIDVGYRAWRAQPWLGRHGMLKTRIAEQVRALAPSLGLTLDISLEDRDTLLGDAWLRFLLRSRVTLGVEGGASILDADGSVKRCTEGFLDTHPNASFEEVERSCFPGRDGGLNLFAISPRHLEACATRTAQILVEGAYNGVLRPNDHYIPVRADFSNLREALELSRREDVRVSITERAFADVVVSGAYTYASFIERALALIGAPIERVVRERPERRWGKLRVSAARATDVPSRGLLVTRRHVVRTLRGVGLLDPVRAVWRLATRRGAARR